MSDHEKDIIETIAKAIPQMTEFDKGYFLGIVESKVEAKKEKELQEV